MTVEVWEKISETEDIETFLAEANPALEPVPFDSKTVTLRKTTLPFYRDYNLYAVSDFDSLPKVEKYLLYKKGHVVPLTWSNEPIYAVNDAAPIDLNVTTIEPYIHFFFGYVRGRHGRFGLVESADDLHWREPPSSHARKALNDMIHPIQVLRQSEDSEFILLANMVFKDSLFRSTITVLPNGRVSLSNEEIMVEGMPVLVDVV